MSLIALLLPAGGAVLTVCNLQRLHAIDLRKTRELIVATIGVCVVGLVLLLLVNPAGTGGNSINGNATSVLGGGMAIVSYLVQHAAFRNWRGENRGVRTGSWLAAVVTAAIYSLVTLVIAVPVMLIAMFTTNIGV